MAPLLLPRPIGCLSSLGSSSHKQKREIVQCLTQEYKLFLFTAFSLNVDIHECRLLKAEVYSCCLQGQRDLSLTLAASVPLDESFTISHLVFQFQNRGRNLTHFMVSMCDLHEKLCGNHFTQDLTHNSQGKCQQQFSHSTSKMYYTKGFVMIFPHMHMIYFHRAHPCCCSFLSPFYFSSFCIPNYSPSFHVSFFLHSCIRKETYTYFYRTNLFHVP